MSRRIVSGVALLVALAPAPGRALTPELGCRDRIANAARTYFKVRYDTLRACRDQQAEGQPVLCGPADPEVAPTLARALSRLESQLATRCTDALVAQLQLGIPCQSVTTVADLVTCITDDAHGADADNLVTSVYDASATLPDPGIQLCQKTIGKQAGKYALARLKQRAACGKKLEADHLAPPCPTPKTQLKLDKAREKMIATIQLRCTDAQIADPSVDFGFPCEAFDLITFDRDGATVNNLIPPVTRLVRCLAAAAAGDGDLGNETAYPLRDAAPFSYGVAAGDATDTAFVAWTRTDGPGAVTLDVAIDDAFRGIVVTQPGLTPNAAADGVVKTEVTGLAPDSVYFYRFVQAAETSRTGRIRTAPAPSSTAPITFTWTGDSNAFFKPFNVLDNLLADDPQMWLYIGDTIYGDDARSGTGVAVTRADYHGKYKENREDNGLRNALAGFGVYAMWDDHEVTNDFWGTDPSLATQMADGNQAFRDYMPLRENGGDPTQLYRSFRWGQVAEFFLIDDRQYRSAPAYVTQPACLVAGEPATLPAGACVGEIQNPARTYLGAAQKAWLENGLLTSTATFKFVMNGPLISSLLFVPYDRWEGYAAERTEMLNFITTNDIKNVVFLSTDIHAAIINNRLTPGTPTIRELVSGAIGMDPIFRELPASVLPAVPGLPALFPSIQYYDLDRFNVATVRADQTQAVVTYRDNTGQVLKTYTIPAE